MLPNPTDPGWLHAHSGGQAADSHCRHEHPSLTEHSAFKHDTMPAVSAVPTHRPLRQPPGTHCAASVQALPMGSKHCPPRQRPLTVAAHAVPSAAFWTLHALTLGEHETTATWQAGSVAFGVHGAPASQVTHAPELQTSFCAPHT
jgi:hypothetical protein